MEPIGSRPPNLKIPWPKGRAGSIPALSTSKRLFIGHLSTSSHTEIFRLSGLQRMMQRISSERFPDKMKKQLSGPTTKWQCDQCEKTFSRGWGQGGGVAAA
jgi:hypothetical protein